MKVAAHREKNEKTGKSKVGKERKQSTDFKEAACCPLLSFKGQHGEKMVCMRGVPGVTGTLGKANSHFDPTQNRVRYCITTLKRLFIGAVICN